MTTVFSTRYVETRGIEELGAHIRNTKRRSYAEIPSCPIGLTQNRMDRIGIDCFLTKHDARVDAVAKLHRLHKSASARVARLHNTINRLNKELNNERI